MKPVCKDCSSPTRPAPRPGPRCASCHRAVIQVRREAAWERGLISKYNMTSEKYWRIFKLQGGCCYVCRRARGVRKRLSVDHDHRCCPTTPTCGRCTRMLACGMCNGILGKLHDDPEAFDRAAFALRYPPAWEIIRDDTIG